MIYSRYDSWLLRVGYHVSNRPLAVGCGCREPSRQVTGQGDSII
eukprot:COSAG01_NODE_19921_length_981_cov_4.710884_2_plen_43_part_01